MSYDLFFWRETRSLRRKPESICSILCDDKELDGIESLPVTAIKAEFKVAFPDIEDGGNELDWEGDGSYFQVSWPTISTPGQTMAIFVTCGYQLLDSPDTMNRIIDVAHKFGCGFYDPQVGKRFDQPEPRPAD